MRLIAIPLAHPCGDDAFADRLRGFAARVGGQQIGRKPRDVDKQIQPVAERPRQPIAVAHDRLRRAAAFAQRVAVVAARAGVHRADEHEVRRKDGRARGYDRVRAVARTIADLEGAEVIAADHLAEALQFRPV